METFNVQERWSQTYKFDFIKNSTEAMRIATKVSLRGDRQGVLNLQLMVVTEGEKQSFLDFRFVPYIQHDEDEDEEYEGEEDGGDAAGDEEML
jgi:cell cycle checkpoint protein